MTEQIGPVRRTGLRSWRILRFVGFFAVDFLRSNLSVLWEIITPGSAVAPAIIEVRLESRTTREYVSIANLLTLTPGTLAVEVAMDPPTLYVHAMFASDARGFVAHVHRLERYMLAAMRPVGLTDGDPAAATGPGPGDAGGGREGS